MLGKLFQELRTAKKNIEQGKFPAALNISSDEVAGIIVKDIVWEIRNGEFILTFLSPEQWIQRKVQENKGNKNLPDKIIIEKRAHSGPFKWIIPIACLLT